MYMQIKPKIGFDNVRLGTSRKEVLVTLGEPSSKCILTSLSKDKEEYGYNWKYKGGIELLFFDDYDYLLSEIHIKSEEALFREKKLIGLSEQDFKCEFPEIEIYYKFSDAVAYIDTEFELRFIVSNNIVEEVTILPETDENKENPVWPITI